MSGIIKISEAASIALHTMVYLAGNPDEVVSTKKLAERLKASTDHLAKVFQRLTKAGMVTSIRGPKGGFKLAKPPEFITLLEIYETIEGPLLASECLLCDGQKICNHCIFGGLITEINLKVLEYLENKKLSDLTNVFGRTYAPN